MDTERRSNQGYQIIESCSIGRNIILGCLSDLSIESVFHSDGPPIVLLCTNAANSCDILIKRNTLVKAYAEEYGIDFRTVSRSRKSPHRFLFLPIP